MKTIILKATSEQKHLFETIQKLEKYADKQFKNAVICTRYLSGDNYNTIIGELKDATNLNDFDLFIIGSVNPSMDVTSVQNINRAHTLVCTDNELDSAKNFVIMI